MRRQALPLLLIGVAASAILLRDTPSSAQDRRGASQQTLEQEIGEVERQVDLLEAEALAAMPSLLPGSPQRLPALGKMLFFDKELQPQ